MSDHTQYDEARQLRAVISVLKAENRQLRKRIAELEATTEGDERQPQGDKHKELG